jgi:NTE family protein
MDGTIGIVLSGGGARGAYEFGALEVLAPALKEPARVVVGTSAGALGAAYLAAEAHNGLEAAARSGGEAWLEVEIGDVIGPLCSPRELARVLLYGLEFLGIGVPSPPSLLDTSPQPETIARLIDFEQLARNVDDRTLAAVGVVATAYATARSTVFHYGGESPASDDQRGIDYVATRLAVEHVQASSAIQSLFPAVRVEESWYGDGGVRLNTPLKPALKLSGYGRLVVIGLNAVAGPPVEYDDRRPDVFDGAAAVAQALLADQLAHDVDTLATINDDVRQSTNPLKHQLVPYIFVAPTDRLAIGRLAMDVYNRYYAGARGLRRNRDLALLGRLLDAGRNPVRGDLLSYLFFAPEFIRPLIEQGRRDAQAWLDQQGRRAEPWRTEHPWPPTARANSAAGGRRA